MISGYEVGPFEVGDDLVVECEVVGGDPLPQVTWWQSGMLYDSSDEVRQVLGNNAYSRLFVWATFWSLTESLDSEGLSFWHMSLSFFFDKTMSFFSRLHLFSFLCKKLGMFADKSRDFNNENVKKHFTLVKEGP